MYNYLLNSYLYSCSWFNLLNCLNLKPCSLLVCAFLMRSLNLKAGLSSGQEGESAIICSQQLSLSPTFTVCPGRVLPLHWPFIGDSLKHSFLLVFYKSLTNCRYYFNKLCLDKELFGLGRRFRSQLLGSAGRAARLRLPGLPLSSFSLRRLLPALLHPRALCASLPLCFHTSAVSGLSFLLPPSREMHETAFGESPN